MSELQRKVGWAVLGRILWELQKLFKSPMPGGWNR
jgi:hypothetical protein